MSSSFSRIWRATPWTSATAAAAVSGTSLWVAAGDDPRQRTYSLWAVPVRLSRDLYCGATILADYQWSLKGLEGEALEAARRACHQRSADRMVALCGVNGGVYIKAGQHLGQMDHLLPAEYVATFRASLLDRCPVSDETEVRRLLVNDFGAPPEQLFARFDTTPIASASLAQVHRAVGHDGRQLAVKVQHAGLRESGDADVATIGVAADVLRYVTHGDFDYRWIVDETRTSLPLELDFEHEAANMARCGANLSGADSRVAGHVVVPQAVPELTSKRVLTMEYMDGVGLNDPEGLKAMGADSAEVAHLISTAFAEMIFNFGDVHCDPHAANMKIRLAPARQRPTTNASAADSPAWALPAALQHSGMAASAQQAPSRSGSDGGSAANAADGGSSAERQQAWRARWLRPWRRHQPQPRQLQLVLLDHGLYRQLDDDFRLDYARLWQALVMADERGIRSAAAAMNAGAMAELFAGMLTNRPWDQVVRGSADHLRIGLGGEEERRQLHEYAQQFAADAAKLMQQVPRALLLLLKTNDCLRSVDATLGQPVNTFLITARACDRALADARWQARPSLSTLAHNAAGKLHLEWRLALFRTFAALAELRAALAAQWQKGAAALGLAPEPHAAAAEAEAAPPAVLPVPA